MNEFFANVGNWFIENKDEILLFLQGICTSGIVGVIINAIFTGKKVAANTVSSKNLFEALPIVGETKQSVDALVERIDKLEADNKALQEENTIRFTEIQNSLDSLLVKVNAIVETESVKAQTIKDETIRTTVGNVLTNAKYTETETRAKLLEQLKALQAQVSQVNEANAAKVAETVAKATALIEPVAEAVVNIVPRG